MRNQLLPSREINQFIKPTLEPTKANIDKQNRGDISAILSKSIIDDETALIEATFDNDFEVATVIRAVASYNRRNPNIIQIFYEPFLQRMESVLRIQRWIKGILFRRKTKPLFMERPNGDFVLLPINLANRQITVDNTLYSHYVLLQRVTRRIQRCYRKWRIRHRLGALINIANYAAKIDSTKLYLEQTMYVHLEQIFSNATGSPWHKAGIHNENNSASGNQKGRPQSKKQTVIKRIRKQPTYAETF